MKQRETPRTANRALFAFVLVFSVFVNTSHSIGYQDPYKAELLGTLEGELRYVERFTGGGKGFIESARSRLLPKFEALWSGKAKVPGRLSDNVIQLVRDEISNLVTEDQAEELERFFQDAGRKQAFYNELDAEGFAAFLDTLLCLSPRQATSIKNRLVSNWNEIWNAQYFLIFHGEGIDKSMELFESVGTSGSDVFLTKTQQTVYKEMANFPTVAHGFLRAGNADSVDHETVKKQVQLMVSLKVEEINELCDLDDDQLRFFSIGSKRMIAECAQNEIETLQELIRDRKTGILGPGAAIQFAMQPFEYRFEQQKVWRTVLDKTLNDEQLLKIQERRQERNVIAKRIHARFQIARLERELALGLTFDEHQKLFELISRSMNLDHFSDFQGARGRKAITLDQIKECLADDELAGKIFDSISLQE